ncbi:MAG TPA: winged helix-turn-helix transcriptional regulator [Solirubrobacterales bacterium]|nr:winged helix-turn-helix transcriptional regulator [Solirubrobacterales bacterium]
MDAACIGGNGSEGRTGTRVLTLLAAPLNGLILNELAQGPRRLAELRHETGSPPQTTLRTHLKQLGEIGVVARRRLNLFPSIREYHLTGLPGRELRFVATTLEGWLANAPSEPLPVGSDAAQAATKALVDGWSSTMLRALAPGPLTLGELNRAVGALGRPSIERRLTAMRLAGLVEPSIDAGDGTPYAVTEWLRRGVAPLAAAIRWERHHLPNDTMPIAPLDAEAGFMLTAPLLRLPSELSGSCRLGVEFEDRGKHHLAGVTVVVEQGRVASWTTRLESGAAAWANGPAAAWLRNTIEADPNRLELGGDERLALALLDGLNRALFGPISRPPP